MGCSYSNPFSGPTPFHGSASDQEMPGPTKAAVLDSGVGPGNKGCEEIYFSEAVWYSASGQVKNCRHFRFSLDMRTLQDSSLEVGMRYYLR